MKKLIFINILFFFSFNYAQSFQVEKLSGSVKILDDNSSSWRDLKPDTKIESNAMISTEKNSYVKLKDNVLSFTLKESSAILISNIKKMSTDELLLALAMENIINTPRKKGKDNSGNTAVYGADERVKEIAINKLSDMGIKRLNGAKQLAENGMKESAIVTAMEIYRKYPETKLNAEYRIYFADLLFGKGLYEEAYDEFTSVKSLPLKQTQSIYVDQKLDEIGKKLLTN
ncbi:MAG: hypothetical protein WAV89_11980 [Ignavibacteriaceae bacterium]